MEGQRLEIATEAGGPAEAAGADKNGDVGVGAGEGDDRGERQGTAEDPGGKVIKLFSSLLSANS